jgi:hypothetical protein
LAITLVLRESEVSTSYMGRICACSFISGGWFFLDHGEIWRTKMHCRL